MGVGSRQAFGRRTPFRRRTTLGRRIWPRWSPRPRRRRRWRAGARGVRRIVRGSASVEVSAYKLELDEKQVAELARILDDLKTERAQGEVDRRRSLSGFADAVGGATFDAARVKEAAQLRVATAERLRDAVSGALGRLHALLDNPQRERLAYLIRTGVLSL